MSTPRLPKGKPLELAGMTDSAGRVGRAMPFESLRVYRGVSLDGDRLTWPADAPWRVVMAKRDLLDKFVHLARAKDAAIVEFARRFGVLELCRHGRPYFHAQMAGMPPPCQAGRAETLEKWRALARETEAFLLIAAALKTDSPKSAPARKARRLLWNVIGEWTLDPTAPQRGLSERGLLEDSLNVWIERAGARVGLLWPEDRKPRFAITSGTLWATVLVQVAQAIAGGGAIAVCSSCGIPYAPKRKPAPQRNNFCNECGVKAAWKLSKRRLRISANGKG